MTQVKRLSFEMLRSKKRGGAEREEEEREREEKEKVKGMSKRTRESPLLSGCQKRKKFSRLNNLNNTTSYRSDITSIGMEEVAHPLKELAWVRLTQKNMHRSATRAYELQTSPRSALSIAGHGVIVASGEQQRSEATVALISPFGRQVLVGG